VHEQRNQLEEKQRRKEEEERRLVDEYLAHVKRERESKKEAIQARLEALQSANRRHEARAEAPQAESKPSLGQARSQSYFPTPEPGTEEATPFTPRPPQVAKVSASKGSQSARGRRISKDANAQPDDKVPHLYKTLGLGAMVADFERIEQQGGGGFRKMPNLKPQQPLKAEPGDEGPGDEKEHAAEEDYLRSQRYLARRQRLRLIRQVATEVLDCKKQLAGCFHEAR